MNLNNISKTHNGIVRRGGITPIKSFRYNLDEGLGLTISDFT